MKKGANYAEIFLLIDDAISYGMQLGSKEMENYVSNQYNLMYGLTSRSTQISNLREDAIINFQEEMWIGRLPQDTNKVDLIAAKIINDYVEIRIAQQKGNNASFNSTTIDGTLEKLYNVKNSKHKAYFDILPDELNPNKNGMKYELDVIIGFTTAVSNRVEYLRRGSIEIPCYCGDFYLQKLGIKSKNIIMIDRWVTNQEKIQKHSYDAKRKCINFQEVYKNCLNEVIKEIV